MSIRSWLDIGANYDGHSQLVFSSTVKTGNYDFVKNDHIIRTVNS